MPGIIEQVHTCVEAALAGLHAVIHCEHDECMEHFERYDNRTFYGHKLPELEQTVLNRLSLVELQVLLKDLTFFYRYERAGPDPVSFEQRVNMLCTFIDSLRRLAKERGLKGPVYAAQVEAPITVKPAPAKAVKKENNKPSYAELKHKLEEMTHDRDSLLVEVQEGQDELMTEKERYATLSKNHKETMRNFEEMSRKLTEKSRECQQMHMELAKLRKEQGGQAEQEKMRTQLDQLRQVLAM